MMRRKLEVLALTLAVATAGCEDEPEVEEEVEVAAAPTTPEEPSFDPAELLSNVAARLGGATMVAGNSLVVEVLPRASGQVSGLVYDAQGNVVQDAKLSVTVKGTDGSAKPVTLEWDAESEVYVGSLDAEAEAELIATGPIQVSVERDGEEAPATGEAAVVAVAPTPVYGGDVVVAGDVSAEIVALPGGAIQLVAYGPDGVITGDADVKVSVPDASGAAHDVSLSWNADASAYLGTVEEGVELGSGPMTFAVLRNGVERRTRVARAAVRAPSHEGDIVVVGNMTVELVPQADGKVYAYAVGRDGAAIDADANAELSFAFGGNIDPIPATWDADAGAYVAVIPPAVDLSAHRIRVRVRRGGRLHRGAIAAPAGRALGVTWRARLESGAGGAIPPGQARAVLAVPDIRARAAGGAVAGASVMGGAAVMVSGDVANQARGAAVMAGAQVRGAGARLNGAAVQARGAAAMVQVRAPSAPMVSVMAAAGGSGGGSAMATTRRREGGASAGASAMAGVMIGFGN